jgi:tetratricopeptide (TPR) repeat protein
LNFFVSYALILYQKPPGSCKSSSSQSIMHLMKYTAIFVLSLTLVLSCFQGELILGIQPTRDNRKDLQTLMREDLNHNERYQYINKILQDMKDDPSSQNLFLTSIVDTWPDNLINGYYLFIVAQNYKQLGAKDFASHYYERIINFQPDVTIESSTSTNFLALQELVSFTDDPRLKLKYYKMLIQLFPNNIDLGRAYYDLGMLYEEIGEWELSYQSFRQFLAYKDTVIPDRPNAHDDIEYLLALYDQRDRSWVQPSSEALVDQLRRGIVNNDGNRLRRLKSPIYFFVSSWEDSGAERLDSPDFLNGVDRWLKVVQIRGVDPSSNDREVYLETANWEATRSTWYFYLRRVYFPADPDIHMAWEWAGILLGDRPVESEE